jgi:phage shock protein A
MGVAKRILHTLKANSDKPRDTAEDSREILDSSYQRQLEMLTQIRRSIADVAAAREHLESQMRDLCRKQKEPDGQTAKASDSGTDRRGRHGLQNKATLETALSDLAAQHYALQVDEERLMAASTRLEAKVESFRVQKETIKAVYTVAEAEQKISDALSSIYKDMDKAGTSAISPQRPLEALAQVQEGVQEIAASRDYLEALVNSLRQQRAELEGNARQALSTGREDLAREALAQRAAIEGQLSNLASQVNSIQADEARLATAYERLAAKIEAF